KAAASGAWSLRETAARIAEYLADRTVLNVEQPADLNYVLRVMNDAKRTAILALNAVARAYGDKAAEEQEVLGLVADIVTEAFAVESAYLRTQKLIEQRGAEVAQIPLQMSRVYASDAAERVAVSARNLAAALADLSAENRLWQMFEWLAPVRPINTVAARGRIAEALLEAKRYRW